MRETFRQYYQPSPGEFDRLWTDSTIVVDANVLLNLYRYSLETREILLQTLSRLRDRLWLPHQVGFEYQRNRIDELVKVRGVYGNIIGIIDSFEVSVQKKLDEHSRHPVLSVQESKAELKRIASQAREYFVALEREHPDMPEDSAPGSIDPIRDRLDEIFSGRIGRAFTEDELTKIYEEGAIRYESQVPPGYRDRKKDGVDKYGDLVIWKEILQMSAKENQSVMFVTDDQKEDWWLEVKGKTIGPRLELLEEIHAGGTEILFHMYPPNQFLQYARERLGNESGITTDAVSEVRKVSEWVKGRSQIRAHRELLAVQRDQLAVERAAYLGRAGRTSGEDRNDKLALQSLDEEIQELQYELDSFLGSGGPPSHLATLSVEELSEEDRAVRLRQARTLLKLGRLKKEREAVLERANRRLDLPPEFSKLDEALHVLDRKLESLRTEMATVDELEAMDPSD